MLKLVVSSENFKDFSPCGLSVPALSRNFRVLLICCDQKPKRFTEQGCEQRAADLRIMVELFHPTNEMFGCQSTSGFLLFDLLVS